MHNKPNDLTIYCDLYHNIVFIYNLIGKGIVMLKARIDTKANKIFIEADIEAAPSKSQKTILIASSHGNKDIGEYNGKRVKCGLNCYTEI